MTSHVAAAPGDTTEVQFDDHHRFHELLGHHDETIKTVERSLGVRITGRRVRDSVVRRVRS